MVPKYAYGSSLGVICT